MASSGFAVGDIRGGATTSIATNGSATSTPMVRARPPRPRSQTDPDRIDVKTSAPTIGSACKR